jgi:hypothetical protein
MAEDQTPWPSWANEATKGDLIRAIVFARSVISELAAAVLAVKFSDDEAFRAHMAKYFPLIPLTHG